MHYTKSFYVPKANKKLDKKLMNEIKKHLGPNLKKELAEIELANKRLGHIKS